MVKAVCGEEASKKLTTVPLSNDTLHRRIVELSNDVRDQIVIKLKEFAFFSLQLGESTDVARFSPLLAYLRFASNIDIEEHFLFCQPLSTATGEDIFNVVDKLFRENMIGPNVFVFVQMALQVWWDVGKVLLSTLKK